MAYNGNGRSNDNGHNPVSEWKLREQMCDVGRRIWLKGFCAGNEGNHSFRLSEDRILCTPSLISKGNLKPDDMCIVDLNGKQTRGKRKRPRETPRPLAIYKHRADAKAVIPPHPPHATAFAVAGVELPTCIHPEAEVFLGPVRTAKYVTPGDTRLGESLLPYVKDSNTILLQNHGTVTFSTSLEDAYYKLEIVDAYSRILLLAKQVGSIRPLDDKEMKELLDLKVRFGLDEPRLKKGGDGLVCQSDFISRVGADIGRKGRVQTEGGGTAPAPQLPGGSELRPHTAVQMDPMSQAIHSMLPDNVSEADVETLVQTITDQI